VEALQNAIQQVGQHTDFLDLQQLQICHAVTSAREVSMPSFATA
jgi:hypothetical protein